MHERRARTPRGVAFARALAALGLALVAVAFAACSDTPSSPPSPTPTIPPARVTVSPANGATKVDTGRGIRVSVARGTIVRVVVATSGDPVTGTLNRGATTWRSDQILNVDTRYTLRVTTLDTAGRRATRSTSFRTLQPTHTFSTQIFEGAGLTYGVGMPITLTFSQPITNTAAVERSLELWSSKRVVGAWYWDGPQTVYFRPRSYWPQNTKVRFVGHLNGVEGAPGVYGTHTLRQDFKIGRSLIVVVDTAGHHMHVYLDRRSYATWPISSGKPGDETPNGTYLTIEKGNPVEMKGPGYDLMVPLSVRFTWSGAYLHAASWSVGSQGFSNVSHGCVNMSPTNAQTYYDLAVPGDPVTVIGSPKAGAWDNGWTMWFLKWREVVAGSALHKAVIVGPKGSRLVRPGSVGGWHADPPLDSPTPGNATAG